MWLQRGDLEKAESVLRHALTIDKTQDNIWIQINALLGEIKKRQGQPAEAEAFFKKISSSSSYNEMLPSSA
jgi:Tfp pilus assembly protein PilF